VDESLILLCSVDSGTGSGDTDKSGAWGTWGFWPTCAEASTGKGDWETSGEDGKSTGMVGSGRLRSGVSVTGDAEAVDVRSAGESVGVRILEPDITLSEAGSESAGGLAGWTLGSAGMVETGRLGSTGAVSCVGDGAGAESAEITGCADEL